MPVFRESGGHAGGEDDASGQRDIIEERRKPVGDDRRVDKIHQGPRQQEREAESAKAGSIEKAEAGGGEDEGDFGEE